MLGDVPIPILALLSEPSTFVTGNAPIQGRVSWTSPAQDMTLVSPHRMGMGGDLQDPPVRTRDPACIEVLDCLYFVAASWWIHVFP